MWVGEKIEQCLGDQEEGWKGSGVRWGCTGEVRMAREKKGRREFL